MSSVKNHYDQHLAGFYSWMAGDPDAAMQRNIAFFQQLGIQATGNECAIDLGSGLGFQAIPLAQLGFSVIAVDFCAALLEELRDRATASNLSIQTVQADILQFIHSVNQPANLITCMGDTLTHLESLSFVQSLLLRSKEMLAPEGKLILTFRDYVSVKWTGTQRFIPVRSDDHRLLTCFLEFHSETVQVYDLLYQKEGDRWVLHTSSYPKLRLNPDWVCAQLLNVGLKITHQTNNNGMVCIVAEKIEPEQLRSS